MAKHKKLSRVGVGVTLQDIQNDFNGNNESLTARVVARLRKLRRIPTTTKIRVVDWTLYRTPPRRATLSPNQVWLVVKFETLED